LKKWIILFFALSLNGCVSTAPKIDGFQENSYSGDFLQLTGLEKNIQVGKKLRVYIDGNARTGGLFTQRAVLDYPVAAQLAKKDKSPSVLYLNRPCYFAQNKLCKTELWEEGRYEIGVIDEMLNVLLKIAEKYHISDFELVGYDGGAAVALLLATRLSGHKINVTKVITIAGILDTDRYALLTDEKLAENSLNPADEVFALSKIPQLHFVGALDKQVPASLVKLFHKKLLKPISFEVRTYPSADHYNWSNFKMDY